MMHVPEDNYRARGHAVSFEVGVAPDGRRLRYQHGGKPYTSPSLWLGDQRIAFWPEDRKCTAKAARAALRAWIESSEDMLGRAQVRAAIDALG